MPDRSKDKNGQYYMSHAECLRSERADHLVNDPILHCLLSVKILVAIEVKLNLQAQITHEQG